MMKFFQLVLNKKILQNVFSKGCFGLIDENLALKGLGSDLSVYFKATAANI